MLITLHVNCLHATGGLKWCLLGATTKTTHLVFEQPGTVQECCLDTSSFPIPLLEQQRKLTPHDRNWAQPRHRQATATTKPSNRTAVRRHCVGSSHRPAGRPWQASDEHVSCKVQSWYLFELKTKSQRGFFLKCNNCQSWPTSNLI